MVEDGATSVAMSDEAPGMRKELFSVPVPATRVRRPGITSSEFVPSHPMHEISASRSGRKIRS